MNSEQRLSVSDWKQFLLIGEELSSQTSSAGQCRLILDHLTEKFQCKADIWLAEPYYPLPGEHEPLKTLNNNKSPEIVKTTHKSKKIEIETSDSSYLHPNTNQNKVFALAAPLKTQNHKLGVVYLERLEGIFSPEEQEYINALTKSSALAFQITRQVLLKNWRAEQLLLVQSVSEQIATLLDLNELCRKVTQLIRQSFDYYYVAIYTTNEDDEILELQSFDYPGTQQNPRSSFSVKKGTGLVGFAAQSGEEIIAPEVCEESHYKHIEALPETQSEAAFPLKVEGSILGVLDIQSNKPNSFHDIDVMVLRALANNIALAIESVHLYHSVNQRADQISTVVEINHVLNSILDLDVLIEKVIQLIQEKLGYPFVHIYLIHPVRQKIIYEAGAGLRSDAMRSHEITFDMEDPEGMIPWVARNGKAIAANDVSKEPLYRSTDLPPANTRAELCVPVKFVDEVLGILDIQSDQLNVFTENSISLLEALASNLAIAVRNAMLYRSEKWRVQVADSFREVSSLISSNIPLDDILDTILSKLENNLPCDASAIWLLDQPFSGNSPEKQNFRLAAVHGADENTIINSLEDEKVRKMIEDVMRLSEPSIRDPQKPNGPLGTAKGYLGIYSSIAAPLRAGGKCLGVMALAHHTQGRYGKEAHDMIATFASYAAVAIQNARLFEDSQEQAWASTVLLQVAEASQSITSVEELLSTMVRLPSLLMGIKLSAIFLWSDNKNAFELRSWYGLGEDPQQKLYSEYDTPILAELMDSHSIITIDDLESSLGLLPDGLEKNSTNFVLLPMLSKNNLIGGFVVGYGYRNQSGKELSFAEQVLSILQGIAHQTSTALENLRLEEAQEEEAYVTAVLLEVAQAVVSQNDLDDILDTIVHILPILVGINTCVVYLLDEKKEALQPAQVFAKSSEEELTLLSQSFTSNEFNLLDKIMRENQVFFCASASSNSEFSSWKKMACFKQDELSPENVNEGDTLLIGFPLAVKGELLGVLLARETVTTLAFQERRLEIINGISRQLSLAIQNEQYKLEMVETERVEQEIKLARQSQQTFLPSELPPFLGWDLFADWVPAREVGGDFYDVIPLDNDHLGLVIADVSDKGMPAALYMTVTRTLVRAYAQNEKSPAKVLEKVNDLLIPDTQNGMFVTGIYAVLSRRTGELTYAIAGHNPPFIMRAEDSTSERLKKGGIALGVLEGIQLEDRVLRLNKGDSIFFYTDGITEAFNEKGEEYGEESLQKRLCELIKENARETIFNLKLSLVDFRGSAPLSDDATMLCVHRNSLED